jgi:hypothetical protein
MLDCGLLTPSQTKVTRPRRAKARIDGEMDLTSLFIGFHPDDVFGRLVSIDLAELIIVFGAIAFTLTVMVAFGNWWSR